MTTKEEVKDKFDAWLEAQPEDVRELVAERFSALENTVKATRSERDNLSGELKRLAKNVDAESDAGKQISEMRNKLIQSEKKSNFIEQAVKMGAKRPSSIYAIANTDNLFTEEGEPDWDRIKSSVPELFAPQAISSDAGSGTNQKPQADSNKSIRENLKSSGTIKIKV